MAAAWRLRAGDERGCCATAARVSVWLRMGSTVAAPRRELTSARLLAAVALVCAPTVLAFFSGGFFDQPRLWAAVAIWVGLALAALAGAPVLPRRGGGRLALAGLALLIAWTLASIAWAPLGGRAFDDGQRAMLYLGAFAAAAALFRGDRVARLVEPTLAAGTVIVIGYGLAGRLLPGIVHELASRQALGRLDQPLTYWNAVGAVAALGIVLCARLAGGRTTNGSGGDGPSTSEGGWVEVGRSVDEIAGATGSASRARRSGAWGRAAAAAACVPLGAGLYLTFSRGAIAAAVVGLIALVALLPSSALRSLGVAALAAVGGALAVAFLGEVTDPRTGSGQTQGAIALAILVAVALLAGLAAWALASRGRRAPGSAKRGRLPGLAIALALVVVVALVLTGVSGVGGERVAGTPPDGASARRLSSVESQRYDYWDVAVRAFADHPLIGVGAGGFKVEWAREQPDGSAPASDAHSLYVETAAELGLVGLVALALLLLGVGLAAARALWLHSSLAVGPIAALVTWVLHAGLDWDWEMPAVTLIAVLLAGMLVALADEDGFRPHVPTSWEGEGSYSSQST